MRTTTRTLLATALAVTLAGCGGGSSDEAETAPDAGESRSSIELAEGDADATFEVEFRDGAVVGGPQRFQAERGELVQLEVASDVEEEVHVHGVDATLAIPAGETAELQFEAPASGAYEVELHDSGAMLGTLEVR